MNLLSILLYATPVTLAATGETVGQRSGVVNIGLEGMMLSSAFFSALVAFKTGNIALALLAGVLAALVLAVLQLIFTMKLACDQVVVGTVINLLSLGFTNSLYRRAFGQTGQLLTLEGLKPIGGLDVLAWVALIAIPVTAWVLMKTRWGLAIRATGEMPKAVDSLGLNATQTRRISCLVAAFFAGLAGAHLSLGVAHSFAQNMTQGIGFLAIAMVTFGRWKPGWVFAAGLLMAVAKERQFALQAMGVQLPAQLFIAAPYVVALLVLVIVGKGTTAPAALGQPYTPSK